MQEHEEFDATRFKPLSEGLGLNHFSDGLPYTPAARKRREMVQFAYPPPRAPRSPQVEAVPENVAQVVEPTQTSEVGIPAPLISRALAFVVDFAFSIGVFAVVVWGSFRLNGFSALDLFRATSGQTFFLPLALLFAVLFSGYFLIQEMTWRRTLGKAIFGVRVSASSGFIIFGRFLLFGLSVLFVGLGLFWSLIDGRHRGLHDILSGSEVVH